MGGRGTASRAKTFTANSSGIPRKAAPGGRSLAKFRVAGDSAIRGASVVLSPKTIRQAVDLPDAVAGHIGSPERRSKRIADAFNDALVKHRIAGGRPNQAVRFSVDMQPSYREKQATYQFKGRMIRNRESGKFDRAAVNLVRVAKSE
jgi:hypothetical protein